MTDQQEQAYHAWRSVIEPQPVPLSSQVRRLFGITEANPYASMALGVDVSHWTPKTKDYSGIDFLVAKLGGSENAPEYGNAYTDDTLNFWAEYAYNLPNPMGGLSVPLLVYYMQNPRVYLDNQMTEMNLRQCSETTHPVFSEVLKAWHNGAAWKQIKEWFYDYEEASYWIAPAYAPIPDYWQRLMTDELRDRFIHKFRANEQPYPFPEIPLGFYSRRSFMDTHYGGGNNPNNMWDYVKAHPEFSTWAANYPRAIPDVSVAEVRANWLPLPTWKVYSLRDDGSWTYWQFAGGANDWNLFNGTPQELYMRLKFTPRPATPEPPPTVTRYFATMSSGGVNIRSTIGTNAPDIGDLVTGTVEVVPAGIADGYTWWEIKAGGFIAQTSRVKIEEKQA